MGKVRRRQDPITASRPAGSSKTQLGAPKPQSTRAVIRKLHVLLKQKASIKSSNHAADKAQLQEIDDEIERMGGLEVYQKMSATGQRSDRGGGSHKVLIDWLRDMGLHKLSHRDGLPANEKGKQRASIQDNMTQIHKLQLLEVGALEPNNYSACTSWLDCTPIDLRSRHPSILQQDFMLLDESNNAKWDVISLSLVLNFVPDPAERGEGRMLRLARRFLKPDTGLLFLVLPLPCVTNSRYLDFQTLHELMASLGFSLLKERWKASGKVAYWLFRALHPPDLLATSHASPSPNLARKKVVREGADRNNFSILVHHVP